MSIYEKDGIPFIETGKTHFRSCISKYPMLRLFSLSVSGIKYLAIVSLIMALSFIIFSLETGKSFHDVCIKPQFDYFDPEIRKFYDKLPKPYCPHKENKRTRLLDGKLLNLQPETQDCWGRCQYFKSSNDTREGEWLNTGLNHTFDCDIVETRCAPIGGHVLQPNHMFLHTQIVEQSPETPKFHVNGKQYDVYFIVIDSQSHSQMFRNMKQTKDYLLKEFEGVMFPYLNRIGTSSKQNGFAWYFGKIVEPVRRQVLFMDPIEPEPGWSHPESCARKMDNETMIISEFGDRGYMTLDAADQWRTIDYGCEGADVPFSHHTYSPYFRTILKVPELPNYLHGTHYCRTHHKRTIGYLSKFIDSYKDKPKFGHIWLSYVGHDSEVGSIEADQPFVEFFEKHKEKLDNSFIFFGGDHGFRQSDVLKTKVGSYDVNNPALIVTVPKELRKNFKLMQTLRENAGELQTHYDTRATLLDIMKFQPQNNYNDQTTMEIAGEWGHSFFREQPKPRTCRTLPIPPVYCICEKPMRKDIVKQDPSRAKIIGEAAIKRINQKLAKHEITEKCREWTFVKTEKLTQLQEDPVLNFEAAIKATNNRSLQAEFFVYLAGKTDDSVELFNFDRIDRYGDNGICVERPLQALCDCF